MSDLLKYAIELIAVLLLALGIKGLSKVRSARGANQLAAVAGRGPWFAGELPRHGCRYLGSGLDLIIAGTLSVVFSGPSPPSACR